MEQIVEFAKTVEKAARGFRVEKNSRLTAFKRYSTIIDKNKIR